MNLQRPSTARRLLIADGAFLVVMGLLGLAWDVASYASGVGPFGSAFQSDPRVIGLIEAHGLAVLVGVAALAHANACKPFWHLHLAATHTLLGTANLIFFQMFTAVGAEPAGAAVTAAHGAFVLLQCWSAARGGATSVGAVV